MRIKSESIDTRYPRVLIVYNSRINIVDQHGVSLRSWFANWPRESLAQIYSGGEADDEGFCGRYFRIGPRERRWGDLFFRLKSSSVGESRFSVTMLTEQSPAEIQFSRLALFKRAIGRLLVEFGLWELLFKPRLSQELAQWVKDFSPDIIYCQGYNLTFTWLPLILKRKYSIPICFQTGDDWPRYLYHGTPLSWLMRPIVSAAIRKLIFSASVRLANGEAMAEEYYRRYNTTFTPMMMCDDVERFRTAIPRKVATDSQISVIYTGSLGLERWQPLLDLCESASMLKDEGLEILVTVLATGVPPEAFSRLCNVPNLQILPAPSHEELPAFLKGADLLFLPESFDSRQVKFTRLSISTKAHLYMMSERPVLIYASPAAGISLYARKNGWGCLIDRQDRTLLKNALKKLIVDKTYYNDLVLKGTETALHRHNSKTLREDMRRILCEATETSSH